MVAREETGVDLISELRLRQWARRNYVPPQQRPTTWHPIVLREMADRDRELAQPPDELTPRAALVPLAPGDMTYLDGAHVGVPAPVT